METLNLSNEPSLYYDPLYERPVEDEFAWHLVKYLAEGCRLNDQPEVQTPSYTFWVGFVVEQSGPERTQRSGFELGDYSLGPCEPSADTQRRLQLRDAFVIGASRLDLLDPTPRNLIICRLDRSVPERWIRDYDEVLETRGGRTMERLAEMRAFVGMDGLNLRFTS